MATELAEAYIHIIPSAQGIKGQLTQILDPEAEAAGKESGSKFAGAMGGVLKGAGALAATAVSAATAGVVALTKQAIDGYSQYEQLVGGVDKLYGSASGKVQQFAAEAYKTSGMSANAYMETATSFSAALIKSLGGDVNKAADMTDVAMRAMSDNVNVFGSDFTSVQNAFQGFAKQNYTMLDNLKLGYGGTKAEMEKLIADANEYRASIGQTSNLSIDSFADIVQAIQSVQEAQHIAGTTSKEAATTIEGSLTSVKAAWSNLVTGMANDNADMGQLVNNLVDSLVGKNGEGLINNLAPRIQTAMEGIGKLVAGLAPIIGDQLPAMINSLLPSLTSAISSLISSLVDAMPGLLSSLISMLPDLINTCVQVLLDSAPMLLEVGIQGIVYLAQGLAEGLPTLIPQLVDVILAMVDTLINNVDLMVDASIALIVGLAEGLINALPKLIEKAPEIVIKLTEAIIRNVPKIVEASAKLIAMLVTGLVKSYSSLIKAGADVLQKIKEGFSVEKALTWGKDLIDNFIRGIKSKWNDLKNAVKDMAETVKSYIGFSEPEVGPLSNFHTYAPDMMELFAKGIKDNEDLIADQMNESLSIPVNMGINTASGGGGSTSIAPTINVYGAAGQDVNELADAIMDRMNDLMYRKEAAYA